MYILDAIINNRDRHGNNFRVISGPFQDLKNYQVLLIDAGLCGPSSDITNTKGGNVYNAKFTPNYTYEGRGCDFKVFMEAYARNDFYTWLLKNGIKNYNFLWKVAVNIVDKKLNKSNVKRIIEYAYKIVPQVKDLNKVPYCLGVDYSKKELEEKESDGRLLSSGEFIDIIMKRKKIILNDLIKLSDECERRLPEKFKPQEWVDVANRKVA